MQDELPWNFRQGWFAAMPLIPLAGYVDNEASVSVQDELRAMRGLSTGAS